MTEPAAPDGGKAKPCWPCLIGGTAVTLALLGLAIWGLLRLLG